jgi:predicted kinase
MLLNYCARSSNRLPVYSALTNFIPKVIYNLTNPPIIDRSHRMSSSAVQKQSFAAALLELEQRHHIKENLSTSSISRNIVGMKGTDYSYKHELSGYSLKSAAHNTGAILISSIDNNVVPNQLIVATPHYSRVYKDFLSSEILDFEAYFSAISSATGSKICQLLISPMFSGYTIQFFKYYPPSAENGHEGSKNSKKAAFCVGIKPLSAAYLNFQSMGRQYTILLDYVQNYLKLLPLESAQLRTKSDRANFTFQELQLIDLFQQFYSSEIQSLTCEFIGNEVKPEGTIGYPVAKALLPLYFTHSSGSIKPVISPVTLGSFSVSPSTNPLAEKSISLNYKQEEAAKLVKSMLTEDEKANESHRARHNIPLELERGTFLSIGRHIYCLDQRGFALGRTIFQGFTADYEALSNSYLTTETVNKLRKAMEKLPQPEQNLSEINISRNDNQAANHQENPSKSPAPIVPLAQQLSLSTNTSISDEVLASQLRRAIDLGPNTFHRYRSRLLQLAKLIQARQQRQKLAQSSPNIKLASNHADQRRIIVLVAFPGAGKSFFSNLLLSLTNSADLSDNFIKEQFAQSQKSKKKQLSERTESVAESEGTQRIHENYIRVNQDELKSRESCEFIAGRALSAGFSVIIDRTNIDPAQRSYWFDLAQQHGVNPCNIMCVHLDSSIALCKQRVFSRENHPTLASNSTASLAIINRFAAEFIPPVEEEDFAKIYTVKHEDELNQTIQHLAKFPNTNINQIQNSNEKC